MLRTRAAIERAVIVARGTSVATRDLPSEVFQKPDRGDIEDSLDLQAQERAIIARALERFRGNRRQAADALKISPVTLWRKMKQYDSSSKSRLLRRTLYRDVFHSEASLSV